MIQGGATVKSMGGKAEEVRWSVAVDMTPTWGEIGNMYTRLAESKEVAAIKQMRSEIAKAMAAAQALKEIQHLLSPEQADIVRKTLTAELSKQGY